MKGIDLLQNAMDSKQFFTNGAIESQESPTTSAHVKRTVSLEKFLRRRCSPRLKNIPQSKRPYYGTSIKVLRQQYDDNASSIDDYNVQQRDPPNGITQNAARSDSVNDSGSKNVDLTSSSGDRQCTIVEPSNNNCIRSFTSSPTLDGKSSYALVRETIRTFDTYYLRLVQEEQIIRNKEEDSLQNDARDLNQEVGFAKRCTLVAPPKLRGVLCMDISGGQEEIRIPVINLVDDMPFAATGFTYSRFIQVAENVDLPPIPDGCRCKGNCMHPKNCACARLNDSKFPYVRHNGGRLRKAKDVVFECGPNCGCGPDCINRISQQGIKYQLEVFRTLDKGWAVRTKDFIPSGAPVCEYRRFGAVSASLCDRAEKMQEGYLEKTPEFCIDANHIGNVSRFINHSCEPNLFVQCVLSTHHDVRLARIVLFAARSISPWQELTYDYGYPLDSVIDSDGKVKVQPCYCGTEDCRKRLY